MVIINWKLRPKGDNLNTYVKYKNDPNIFSLKIKHGGGYSYVYGPKRTMALRHVYKGGNADWFDDVNADGFSVIEVSGKGLGPLSNDIDVLNLLSYVHKFKLIELFIKHLVDTSILNTFVMDLDHEDDCDDLGSSNVGLGTHESDGLESGNDGLGSHESDGLESGNDGLGTHESEGLGRANAGLGTHESEGIKMTM
ncbi:hypothetical protein Tco_0969018 [Tanacetum coccineum]